MTDAAARRLPEFIKTLRINRAERRESVYAADNVYALLDACEAAEARVRELEAELADQRVISKYNREQAEASERALAEACERAARCAEGCDLPERTWMPGSLYDTIRREVAAAIRSMRKEER